MKFCSKCGKELLDEAVICTGCGCSVNGMYTTSEQKHPIIKTGYGKLFGICMGTGVLFGILMALLLNRGDFADFLTIFLITGALFGLLFFGAMALVVYIIENSTVKNARQKFSMKGQIYFEGAANYNGNGGWIFVTQNGIEYFAHKANFDSRGISLPYADVITIKKSQKKLSVQTSQGSYLFVVEKIDQWMSLFAQCDQTKEKL